MNEIRHAFRRLCRTPGFTLVALVTIALGIGANVAVFSILNALVLRHLPVAHAEDLASVTPVLRNGTRLGLSFRAFAELRQDSEGFASWLACACDGFPRVEINGEVTRHSMSDVTGNFFSELGGRPLLGRLLTPGDVDLVSFAPSHVAVVSYAFWRQWLGGDPAAVGRTITVETQPYTVIGVTPREFRGLSRTVQSDIFLPLTALGQAEANLEGALGALQVFGRRKPGVSLTQARAEVETRWPNMLAATMPSTLSGVRRDNYLAMKPVVTAATTYIDHLAQTQYTQALVVVSGLAALMLIIACVNLAGLMLSRLTARTHDMAIELALGASRWRVVRQALAEGLLVAAVGSLAGLAAAPVVSGAVSRMILGGVARSLDVHPDAVVLVACLAATVVVGLAFSGVPAWQAMRRDRLSSLREHDLSVTGGRRLGRVLVIAQVALSVMLVTNAGLLTRTVERLRQTPEGFDITDVTIAAFERQPGGPLLGGPDLRAIIDEVATVPGVQRASLSNGEPEGGYGFADLVTAASAPGDEVRSERDVTTPGFFQTLGIPLLQGRDFAWTDGPNSNVVIISHSLATRLYGTHPAVGDRLRMGTQNQDLQVVGIVADVRLHDVKNGSPYAIYTPVWQEQNLFSYGGFLILKGRVAAADLRRAISRRGLVLRIGPLTLASVKDQALLRERLIAAIAEFFGALTLLLACIGVYGLMASAVIGRTRELGIRQALGATRMRILGSVLLESTVTTILGIAFGIGGAFFTVRLVQTLLFGLSAYDPLTLLGVPGVLFASALGASLVPAIRAARVNVMRALRAE